MDVFMEQVMNGISLGSIFALIALGYTMVYGTIKLINFAHGDVFMLGTFIGNFFINRLQLNLYVSLILTMVVCALIGVIIERVAYKPLRGSTRVAALITAIGVSYLIQNTIIYFFGADTNAFQSPITVQSFELFGVAISTHRLLIFATTIILMVALYSIVKFSKMGKAMRAVAVDEDAAKLMGIDVDNVISFTFALGSGLAGIAGVLVGIYYGSYSAMMGVVPGLKAFVAAVLGGIGSIPGAMVGGYVIGMLETFTNYLGFSTYRDAVVYFLLIIILLVMPAGLFGKNVREKV